MFLYNKQFLSHVSPVEWRNKAKRMYGYHGYIHPVRRLFHPTEKLNNKTNFNWNRRIRCQVWYPIESYPSEASTVQSIAHNDKVLLWVKLKPPANNIRELWTGCGQNSDANILPSCLPGVFFLSLLRAHLAKFHSPLECLEDLFINLMMGIEFRCFMGCIAERVEAIVGIKQSVELFYDRLQTSFNFPSNSNSGIFWQ